MFPGGDDGRPCWTTGGTDYGGCVGAWAAWYNQVGNGGNYHAWGTPSYIMDSRYAGVLIPNTVVTFASIVDGSSRTLLAGELQRLNGPTDPTGREAYKSLDGWAVGGVSNLFDTQNLSPVDLLAPAGGPNNGFFENPGSEHAGGAHFVLVDGSVHFISENIDGAIFCGLGSRAGTQIGSDSKRNEDVYSPL